MCACTFSYYATCFSFFSLHTSAKKQIMNPLHENHLTGENERAGRLQSLDGLESAASDVIPTPANARVSNNIFERMLGVDSTYELDGAKPLLPQIYSWNYVGLFAHYAGVGFTGGMLGMSSNFCFYFYKGAPNVCANAGTLIAIPWGFKIFYAIATDSFRPYGYRRKLYMLVGWSGVLFFTFLLSVAAAVISAHAWIGISLIIQAFLMLADVPADGYSVEIGQLEKPDERGQVLATGQRIRFCCTILGGLIQAFLVNGPTTNPRNCPIQASNCWAWGFNPNEYYGFILCILFVLVVPIFFLKEPDARNIPISTLADHKKDIWETMQNPTTLYLLIFVSGNNIFSTLGAMSTSYIQYNVIQLSNFQSGISSILSGMATVGGILIFQTYFILRNWRTTQYISTLLCAFIGLLWLPVYYNSGGMLNAWFTIFLQCTLSLSSGLAQVLFAMAVIELAKKGQEATTYELIISTANSAGTISSIISTQLLSPMHANTCSNPSGTCPHDEVNTSSAYNYFKTDGPNKFMAYTLLIFVINLCGIAVFTGFLPRQKDQCEEWKNQDYSAAATKAKAAGGTGLWMILSQANDIFVSNRVRVGYTATIVASVIILYEVVTAVALLNPNWSCNVAFGGSGCRQE